VSIAASLALGGEWQPFPLGPLSFVAGQTGFGFGDETVLLAGSAVNVMATQARHRPFTEHDYVADILQYVPVCRTHVLECPIGEVGLKIAKQVVPRYKVGGIWTPGVLRFAGANVALTAD
jgi:hypothetical protein